MHRAIRAGTDRAALDVLPKYAFGTPRSVPIPSGSRLAAPRACRQL